MLNTIQILRAVAVLLVACMHGSEVVNSIYGNYPFQNFFRFGFSGVFIFFVISGFVIGYAHRDDVGSGKLLTYMLRRITRVYPIYLILVSFIGGQMYLSGKISAADLLSNAFLFHAIEKWVIPVSWTMFWEMCFYIVFSAYIIKSRIGMAFMLSWTVMNALALRYIKIPIFSPVNCLFALGLMGYYVFSIQKRLSAQVRDIIGIISVAAGLAAFIATAKHCSIMPLPIAWAFSADLIASFGLSSFLLVLSSMSQKVISICSRQKLLALIGDASYSIYLTHTQIEELTASAIKQLLDSYNYITEDGIFIICIASSILGGIILYIQIEKPLITRLRIKINNANALGK